MKLKELKRKLEKDFGWENLGSDDNKWFVDVFEEDNIRFTTKEDLEIFINIVNKNKKL